MTDTISDYLTRLRNAIKANRRVVWKYNRRKLFVKRKFH